MYSPPPPPLNGPAIFNNFFVAAYRKRIITLIALTGNLRLSELFEADFTDALDSYLE